MELSTPIEELPNVGSIYQKRLKKLGIKTVQDLLYHFPHRYEDFSNISPISKIKYGQDCCIQGKILEIQNTRTWRKRMILTQALVQDRTGAIKVIWFNQPYLIKTLKPGDIISLAGKTNIGESGLYLSNPAHEKIQASGSKFPRAVCWSSQQGRQVSGLTHTGRIVPVYPETEGLSSRWLRWILKPLLIKFKNEIRDPVPEKIRRDFQLLPIKNAIFQIHFPNSLALAKKAQERFSFEELFFIELTVLRQRIKIGSLRAQSIPLNLKVLQRFTKSLPFKLTDTQKKSAWQILKDLEKPRPMNRLLEGDVGSGKTVVATLAVLNTTKQGFQAAFMAPTEVLTKQHFKTVWELLKNFNLNVGLLTGKEDRFFSKKLKNQFIEISRKKLLEKTRNGEIDILVGTHALIQDKVKFRNLALVIVDEQHRFGVEQRAKLTKQPTTNNQQPIIPHLLSMTATPIPRTLALTIYGDLDLSLISELPKGRKKIITKVVPPKDRDKTYNFIRKQIKRGRQAFIICPRIEGQTASDYGNEAGIAASKTSNGKTLNVTAKQNGLRNRLTPNYKQILSWAEVKAVKEEYEKLSKQVFPDLKVAMMHGRLATKEKEKIMREFKNKKIDILVSTSVIEVGIDVPNATVMMIEGAERFGLAQLHQFRGRVGRSRYQSYCFLFTDSPAKKTRQRLKALIDCENGFELAEKDLKIRGPGDFTGTRQWGIPDLAMSALKDIFLVEKTRQSAKEILIEDPKLKKYPLLQERLKKFRERIHLE